MKTLIATPSKFNIAALQKRSKVITKAKSAAKKQAAKARKVVKDKKVSRKDIRKDLRAK